MNSNPLSIEKKSGGSRVDFFREREEKESEGGPIDMEKDMDSSMAVDGVDRTALRTNLMASMKRSKSATAAMDATLDASTSALPSITLEP